MARPARRQPSQSQRQAPTQSQRAGPSRSQATRRNRVVSDEEEGEEIPANVDGEDSEDGGGDEGEDAINQKASDLVRLALFHEARRLPLKRDEINKKVLQNSRYFKPVYDRAQRILETTFGLQLVELPSKSGLDQEAAEAAAEIKKAKKVGRSQAANEEDELEEARKAAAGRRKATTLGSKTYILRSVLDGKLIELANKPDPDILEEEAILDFGSGDFFGDGGGSQGNDGVLIDDEEDWDDNVELHPRTHGSILSWSQNDQLGALGILYVILALILVNGRVVQERVLRAHLKELGLPSTAGRSPIHLTTISTHRSLKLDDYLSQLLRQNYLDRQVVGEVSGAGRKRARGKVGGGDGNNDGMVGGAAADMYEWRWGARAFCEVGEKDIAKFVAEFMANHGAGAAGRDEGDDEDGAGEQRKKERVKKMYMGVEKAAGGTLAEIRDWES